MDYVKINFREIFKTERTWSRTHACSHRDTIPSKFFNLSQISRRGLKRPKMLCSISLLPKISKNTQKHGKGHQRACRRDIEGHPIQLISELFVFGQRQRDQTLLTGQDKLKWETYEMRSGRTSYRPALKKYV